MRSLERIEGTAGNSHCHGGDGNNVMKVDDGDGLLTVTPVIHSGAVLPCKATTLVIHSGAHAAAMREIGMEENAETVAEKTER